MQVIYRRAQVANRHTVVPHPMAYAWMAPAISVPDAAHHNNNNNLVANRSLLATEEETTVVATRNYGPSTGERMRLYEEHASGLALEASQQALRDANVNVGEITHLITVSCTGFRARRRRRCD